MRMKADNLDFTNFQNKVYQITPNIVDKAARRDWDKFRKGFDACIKMYDETPHDPETIEEAEESNVILFVRCVCVCVCVCVCEKHIYLKALNSFLKGGGFLFPQIASLDPLKPKFLFILE